MTDINIYRDIAARTGGDIYIGVVGPVRTGKSTFIKRFTEELILPNLAEGYSKERLRDELPQSGAGRVIMTNQPKFVPDKAVEVVMGDHVKVNVRLVDCVGFLVEGASGHTENGMPRMVRTPWFDYDIPFEKAADIGTKKVIANHSTIGLVVTTDGSITELPRQNYEEAEARCVKELKALGKPFAVIINSKEPDGNEAEALKRVLQERYDVPVHTADVSALTAEEIEEILSSVLMEFPLKDLKFNVPEWIFSLEMGHWLLKSITDFIKGFSENVDKIKNLHQAEKERPENEYISSFRMMEAQAGTGQADFEIAAPQSVFYRVLSERCGCNVSNDFELFDMLKDFVQIKEDYARIEPALRSVRQSGYGVVQPSLEEMMLEEPEIVRQGSKFGVKLKASAPSLHFLRADIETIVSPIVGTEKQSEELVKYLLDEFETDKTKIWETDIFGKSLHQLVKEGLSNKLTDMPADVCCKMQETLQRIINDGTEGVMCIIL